MKGKQVHQPYYRTRTVDYLYLSCNRSKAPLPSNLIRFLPPPASSYMCSFIDIWSNCLVSCRLLVFVLPDSKKHRILCGMYRQGLGYQANVSVETINLWEAHDQLRPRTASQNLYILCQIRMDALQFRQVSKNLDQERVHIKNWPAYLLMKLSPVR